MRTIHYAIDRDNGMVVSGVERHHKWEGFAWPVYDYAEFGKDGDFSKEMTMTLTKFPADHGMSTFWHGANMIHTKKIPLATRNEHRVFWGMKPLTKETKRRLCISCFVKNANGDDTMCKRCRRAYPKD